MNSFFFNQSLLFYCSAKMIFFPTAAAPVARIVCIVCYHSFVLSYCPSNRIRRSARSVFVHMPFGYVLLCRCSCVYDFFFFQRMTAEIVANTARCTHGLATTHRLYILCVCFLLFLK